MEQDFPTFIQDQTSQWLSDATARLAVLQASRANVADLVASLQGQFTASQAQLNDLDASIAALTKEINAAPVLADAIANAVDAASGVKEVPTVSPAPVTEVSA